MLIDSHCHLNFIDLSQFHGDMSQLLAAAQEKKVTHFLCVCVELTDYPILCQLADQYPSISISVGLHPNSEVKQEPTAIQLSQLATQHRSCIAIGETGLDYYRTTEHDAQEAQRQRFREHIYAAIDTQKPLIIHTRQSADDTINLMREEQADRIGGVMHCFSESWEIAKKALDLGFYISLSGILTFKNATNVHEVAKKVPLDRLLIETDSPYLAPAPFRGQQNHPALVYFVAEQLAALKNMDFETIAKATTDNFYRCFKCHPSELS